MKKIIEKYSAKPAGLFKTLFITFLFSYIPIAVIHIILNLAEIIPVNFNDKAVYGIMGVFIIIIFIPLVVMLITITTWLYFMLGNLFLRIIRKILYEL